MSENYHKDVSRYRIQRAMEFLSNARQNFQLGNYKLSVSQAYYCILTSMRALLALKHFDSKRHEGVITLFHQHFIMTNIFPKHYNRTIKEIKNIREEADYGDFIEITKQFAEQEIANAERFFITAEKVFTQLISMINNKNSNKINRNK
ncbi:MAG: HEPN domain-containing protein [Bacteroidota bacterium]|nr:HEPN domain-containing protein [Bacteroidota bacterium]